MRWRSFAALVLASGLASGLAVGLTSACGGDPLLSKVPRPDNGTAAGVGAVAATAATLVDPKAAANLQEARKPEPREPKLPSNRETVPPDVLDRLDEAEAKGPTSQPSSRPAASRPAYLP